MTVAPTLTLLNLLAATTPALAAPWSWEAYTGMPRLVAEEGQAQAWRPLVVSLSDAAWQLEARLPACLPSAPCAHPLAQLPLRGAGGQAPAFDLPRSWELQRQFSLPGVEAGNIHLLARGWSASGSGTQRQGGSELELSWSHTTPGWEWSAGITEPLGASRREQGWRSRFASVSWAPDERQELALSIELANALGDGARERELHLRYDVRSSADLRWRLQAQRQWDDPQRPWEASVGIDWRF